MYIFETKKANYKHDYESMANYLNTAQLQKDDKKIIEILRGLNE